MTINETNSNLAVSLPNGELSPIPQEVAERWFVKAGELTPFTRLPIVEVLSFPLDTVN